MAGPGLLGFERLDDLAERHPQDAATGIGQPQATLFVDAAEASLGRAGRAQGEEPALSGGAAA